MKEEKLRICLNAQFTLSSISYNSIEIGGIGIVINLSLVHCVISIFICHLKFLLNRKSSHIYIYWLKDTELWTYQCTNIHLQTNLSVAFEEQQKPLEPQHQLCFGRDIITSQGYLTLNVLIFRSRARIRIPGLVKTWKWLLVVLHQVFYSLSSFAAIFNKLIVWSKFILAEAFWRHKS